MQAKDQRAIVKIDASDKIFDLGTRLDSPTDFYAKVFFGTGDGPAKAPKFAMTEPTPRVVEADPVTITYVSHAAGSGEPSTLHASLSDNATFSGVGTTATIFSDNNTNISALTTSDQFIDFADSGARRMDITREVQAGETVMIRFAACTFDSNRSNNPLAGTSFNQNVECAESSDDGVIVKVSLDGGTSYVDVATVFTCKMDGVVTTDSELFSSDSSTFFKTPRFDEASADANEPLAGSNPVYDDPGGARKYPLFQFAAASNCKIRLEQLTHDGVAFDHYLLRFLKIAFVPPSAATTPISGRGNFNQGAVASKIEIRGAKYGLISPIKLNTSAIFRAGSFGQCRDMLEQRKFARTFDGQRVSEPTVAVSFQARNTKRVVSPEETNSANLDAFCTSSLPYFDGLNVDRDTQQPDLVDAIDIDIQV